jgi:hypothetical protein
MRILFVVLLVAGFLTSCNNSPAVDKKDDTKKEETDEKTKMDDDNKNTNTDNTDYSAGWTSAQRTEFVTTCVNEASSGADGMTVTAAKSYCECMLPKFESAYPSYAEANRVTETDLQSDRWMTEVKKCLGIE